MMKYVRVILISMPLFLLLLPSGCNSRDYTVMLTWDVPTTNVDRTPLTDLAGYIVFIGTSPQNYSRTINIPIGDRLLSCKDTGNNEQSQKKTTKCSYTVTGLQQGDYYFAISAYNGSKESTKSNEVKKTAVPSEDKK
jgi:hypothetical protein